MTRTPETIVDESWTLAEDAAWKLVSVNQAMVIGPLLQPTLNTSAAALLSLIKDVANAHIQAFENPEANGRYCLVERVAHYSEVVNILHHLYPDFLLPEK
uniref:Uncharacterized protein n=1 Tax=Brassica oleracea var. oleracea TaxID=109376 RepID=A0A0D3CPZ8_BRAOL